MTGARDDILAALRRSLGRGPLPAATADALTQRLAAPTPNLIPARATSLDHDGRVALFIAMAREVETTVTPVVRLDAVPDAIADYLAAQNLPSRIVVSSETALAGIPWERRPLLGIRTGIVGDDDPVGVTACVAGIAETGTLMLVSGRTQATRSNFLPDTHIVVLRRDQVVGGYEEAWTLLRRAGALPRTVNLITGPSRTGDIEQRIVLGAHGPRRLLIVLLDGDDGPTRG